MRRWAFKGEEVFDAMALVMDMFAKTGLMERSAFGEV